MGESLEVLMILGTFVGFVGSVITFFSCLSDYNSFFKGVSKLDEIKEKIKLAEAEEHKVGTMLKEMMDKYLSYETEMVGGQGCRHENLLALADKFPELKTNEVIQDTASQLKSLTQQVTRQKESYNRYVQILRSASMEWPSRWFVPKSIDISKIDYLQV